MMFWAAVFVAGSQQVSCQMTQKEDKMKIEIWSDVVCPFCYIGKANLEKALSDFSEKDNVEIIWRSYQLQPEANYSPGMTATKALAQKYGIPESQAQQMNANVTARARESGLEFHTDKMLWANSLDAHRLIQLASAEGNVNALQANLFKAVFTDGQNIQDKSVLIEIARASGIDEKRASHVLNGDEYTEQVNADIRKAEQLGLRGVPTFLINDSIMFSGALPVEDFRKVLEEAKKGN